MGGSSSGCFVEFDEDYDVIRGYQYNRVGNIHDYLNDGIDRKILLGRSTSNEPIIFEVAVNGLITWARKMDITGFYRSIDLVSKTTTADGFIETYLIQGGQDDGNGELTFVQKLEYEYSNPATATKGELKSNNGTHEISVIWTKQIDDGATVTSPRGATLVNGVYITGEVRKDHLNNFGDFDVLTVFSDEEYNMCDAVDITATLVTETPSRSSLTPTKTVGTTPTLTVVNQSSSDFNFHSLCALTTCEPIVQLEVEGGDLFLSNRTKGVIMQSSNGLCYRLRMNNDGSLSSESVTCPE